MSLAESKFDEFAGSVFYVLGSSTVVQYYEGVGVFANLTISRRTPSTLS